MMLLQFLVLLGLVFFLNYVVIIFMVLLLVAFLVLYERKLLGFIQERKGPNVVGIFGLVQTVYDGLKLLSKNTMLYSGFFFVLIPIYGMIMSLLQWVFVPLPFLLVWVDYSILFTFIISGLMVYVTLGCGWQSVNSYGVVGSIRSIAQMISYEVIFFFFVMMFMFSFQNFSWFNFLDCENFNGVNFSLFLVFIWMIMTMAELNRSPFDLVEGESELVSGFNTEYLGYNFTLLFLSEYANIWLMAVLFGVIFGHQLADTISLMLLYVLFTVVIRGFLPRLKFSDLINLTWKVCLPFIFLMMIYFLMF
uniref:NADH-ubiquinone oxidoreductase chain 1 n=1 Tax=Styela clava TaxID=7725 RepID=A0A024HWC5_STYCL|nr:NADH dehydrogenase subunit 1 [Styela clava]CDM98921.1 NADH dehydrogenase subunit 1 [Styela clava]